MSELTHDDVKRILAIIDSIGDRTVSLEVGDIKLHMTRAADAPAWTGPAPAAAPANPWPAAPASAPPAPAPTANDGVRKPKPTEAEAAVPAAMKTAPVARAVVPDGVVAVTAPTSGTFYRAASPNAKPFVEVGDHVESNDTVGILDVMKLFMSLRAGVAGTVTAIPAENQAVAEQGEPLILIKPD